MLIKNFFYQFELFIVENIPEKKETPQPSKDFFRSIVDDSCYVLCFLFINFEHIS